MLLLDGREGSKELRAPLKTRNLPVEVTHLDFGDIAFTGRGPDGRPVLVGIEYKTIREMLTCMRDGRFVGHQLPGLLNCYESAWLLLEGQVRQGRQSIEFHGWNGVWAAVKPWQKVQYSDLMSHLFTLTMKTPLRIAIVRDKKEAADWLGSLYSWWTKKGWEEHDSAVGIHQGADEDLRANMLSIVHPTQKMLHAKQLPGIGMQKVMPVARHFPSVQAMFNADVDDWVGIEWKDAKGKVKRLGKKVAAEIVRQVRAETKF